MQPNFSWQITLLFLASECALFTAKSMSFMYLSRRTLISCFKNKREIVILFNGCFRPLLLIIDLYVMAQTYSLIKNYLVVIHFGGSNMSIREICLKLSSS